MRAFDIKMVHIIHISWFLFLLVLGAKTTISEYCDRDVCKLPWCYCAGNVGPEDKVPREKTPQMLLLTIDDSINSTTEEAIVKLQSSLANNPNGCPVSFTFFVIDPDTDYDVVKRLYGNKHEIACHSVSHREPPSWWTTASLSSWENEIVQQRNNLISRAGIASQDLQGMRAPFLESGGDAQFKVMTDNNFQYDSSFKIEPCVFGDCGAWPFTLDFAPPTRYCWNFNCPEKEYPSFWEIPVNSWFTSSGEQCEMTDDCHTGLTKADIRQYLSSNFNRFYWGNRAPLTLSLHTTWFQGVTGQTRLEALTEFLKEVQIHDDVYIISMKMVIDWMKNPVSLDDITSFTPWKRSC